MTAREVVLDGGSPWGFRMHGGADVGQPLRISRVNPGSKAALKGVREGDVISSINGQSTRNVSNSDAHALLRNAGQTLHLGLNEECSGSPKRRNFRNTAQNDAGRQRVGNGITTATNSSTVDGRCVANGKLNGNAQGELKLDNEGANAKGRRGRRCRSRRRRGRAAQVRKAASAAVDQVLEEAVTRVASRLEEVVWETAEDIVILPGPCPCPRNVPAVLVEEYDEPPADPPPPPPPSMPPHEERRLREFLQSLEIVKRSDEPSRTEPSRRSRRRAVAEHFTRRSRSLDVILEEPSEEKADDAAKPRRTSPRSRNYSLGEETLGEVCTVKESFIAKSHVEELVAFQQSTVTTWQKEEPQECNRVVIAEVEDTDTETGTPGEEGSVEMVASEDDDVEEIDFEPTHSVEIVCASPPPPPPPPEEAEPLVEEDNEVAMSEQSDRTADVVFKLLQVLPKQDSSQSSMYTVLSQLTIGQIASLSSGFKKNIEAMLETSTTTTTAAVSEGEVSSEGGDDESTPPHGHSRQGSSSSEATSHNTAVYFPSSTPEPCFQPPSLRVAALKVVLTLPGGSFLLSELDIGCSTPVFSPTSSVPPTPPPLPHYFSPASMSPSGSSWISTPPSVPTPPPMMSPPPPPQGSCCWTGIQSRDDPRLYVCLSPAQTDSYDAPPDADALLDLHHKFMWRRSYNEQSSRSASRYSQLPPTPPSRRARHGLLHSREWEASSHRVHVTGGPPDAAAKISTTAVAGGSTGGGEDGGGRPQRGAPDARGAASRAAMMKLDTSSAAACGGGCCARSPHKDEEQRLKAQMLSEWLTLARAVPDVEDAQRRVYRVNSVDSTSTAQGKNDLPERRLSLQETEQRLSNQSRPPLPQSPKRVHQQQQHSEAQRYLQKLRERHQKHQLEEEERILRERLLLEAPVPRHNRLQEIREQVVAHVKDYSGEERQMTQRLELETRNNTLQNNVQTDTNQQDGLQSSHDEPKTVESYKFTNVRRMSDEKNKGNANDGTTTVRRSPFELARIEETTNIQQDYRLVRGQTSQVFRLSGGAELEKKQPNQKTYQSSNNDEFRRLNVEFKDLDEFSNDQESNRTEERAYGRRTSNDSLGEEPLVIVDTEKSSTESKDEVLQQVRRFEANKYKISKRGDIAVIQEGAEPTTPSTTTTSYRGRRPKSLPPATDGELFRQQMYHEYMAKVAELAERQRQKVIRLSMRPEDLPSNANAAAAEARLEAEFMGRVRQMGLANKGDSDDEGGGVGAPVELPKHLQELLDAAAAAAGSLLLLEIDAALRRSVRGFLLGKGVWTPKSSATPEPTPQPEHQQQDERKDNQQQQDVPQQPVWTPAASPTAERRFRPVNFTASLQVEDSTKQTSSSSSSTFIQQSQSQTSETSVLPPWKQPEEVVSRLVQSQSAPASGLSSLTKLPRAQNPTITLLQKAREGQLPKGALYLDHKMTSKEMEKATFGQHEILYTVKKEYEKEMDGQRKKIAELGPRKFEGIGPTTKEGIPIVLRSEVKDTNQAKWYKRMYDSLHRTGKDDDFITIRYRPRRGHYPYTSAGGYLSEPEPGSYDSDVGYNTKYATLDRRRIKNKENDFTTSTVPRSKYVPHPSSIKYATEIYKNQPGRIEDYEPGHSSISDRETKQWWDEVLDIFDGWLDSHSGTPTYRSLLADAMYHKAANEQLQATTPSGKPFMTYALKESGYESDSTLVFKRRDDNLQNQLSPAEQKLAYKTIQKGGEVPLHGLRKPAPERPKEPAPPARSARDPSKPGPRRSESPHRYVESEVTIHYRSPVRSEAKEALSEEELARRQAEAMRRIYQEERRRKYLQELQDMHSRRHTDNFTPSQKSPIPLNRYDDFLEDSKSKPRDRTPEPKLVARALYNFVGQTSRELTFRRGDIIFVRRQIDKNWYEGEHNAMVGLFPLNYVEIIPYDGIRTIPKRPSEGQAKAKFNFIAQTHLELSLVKGELVVLTRRVDDNWYEGRIGARKGIFPVSYVEVLQEPGDKKGAPAATSKPATTPTVHSVLVNGSGLKQQPYYSQKITSQSYTSSSPYATLPRQGQTQKQPLAPVNQTLHIDTHQEPVPYRALYNYRPQNEDELELREGDTVYVMEKCDDGWYVGSSQRTGFFGTFPGNYVERLL